MLAMDVPIAVMAGLVLSEAGQKMIESKDREKTTFMRIVILMYAALFITPTPFYYLLGWPAWEVNFLWKWVDHIHDHPLRAAFSYALFALAVIPTYLGFELGRFFILKGKYRWVRICYIAMLVLVGIIIFLLRDITFNIASTYERYEAREFYSFWSHPFVTGWAITSLYFWGSLVIFYIWLRKKK
ncbi:MAG: hypothetical protein ACC630_06135 [Nitrospinota bacterium]